MGLTHYHRQIVLLVAFSAFMICFTISVGSSSCAPLPIFYACVLASIITIGASCHKLFFAPEHTESMGAGLPFRPHATLLQGNQSVPRCATHRGSLAISGTDLSFSLFDSLGSFSAQEWDALIPQDKLFLQSNYLQALTKAPPANATQRYGMLFSQDKLVGVAYFQLLTLDSAAVGADIDAKWLHRALRPVASLLGETSKEAPIRLLICGNALLSGEYGFHYTDEITPDLAFDALARMMKALQRKESKDAPVPLMAIKDYAASHPGHATILEAWGYRKLTAEPAMSVPLQDDWKCFEDYTNAMSSKYRKRVREARKKGKQLQRKLMSAEDIKAHTSELQALFDNVVKQAGFVLATLDVEGFLQMKRTLQDDFQLTGYFLNDKLVGFNITYLVGEHLDANLVGIDYDVNLQVSLYQNMLYDFVEAGINNKCKSVHMGRTALEIKSTVGAEPEDLAFYVRHPNTFYNSLLAPFAAVVPKTEWVQRRPFKDEQA